FENTYITVTTGEIFEFGSSTIMNAIKDFNPFIIKKEFSGNGVAKGLFGKDGDGVKIHRFGKPSEEIEWVCKKAKSLLLEGYDPQDFEIVVKSEKSNYIKEIENKLEEYSITLSYLGKKKLAQNTAVQKVMLPLRVASGGYPQDLLMSMITAGFGGETAEFPIIYSKAHLDRGPMKLSYRSRLEDW
ncbi:3'-5' exonuclease, partial [Athalassotoga sp.]|uniref:3'-5' exonuclease n=1 Tax=Athalassotoga sp. TaxID=2022597 RepID=UPI003D019F8D